MKLNVLNMAGKKAGTVEVSDSIFAREYNEALIHQVVVAQLANKRQGTMSALTRTEVRGGGCKPYRQKEQVALVKALSLLPNTLAAAWCSQRSREISHKRSTRI